VSQNWQQFGEYLRNFPLPEPKIMHSLSFGRSAGVFMRRALREYVLTWERGMAHKKGGSSGIGNGLLIAEK
jgi:hypothetical protein